MSRYSLEIQCKGFGASDDDADGFKLLVESYVKRLIDVAQFLSLEVESVYLIKTTDSAPADSEREEND